MAHVLVSWIGHTDLRAVTESARVGYGPVLNALRGRAFDAAVLVTNSPEAQVQAFEQWVGSAIERPVSVSIRQVSLTSPMNFTEVHNAAVAGCEEAVKFGEGANELTFHLSPGTPVMAAVWMILAKSRFSAAKPKLIASSHEKGVEDVDFPFDLVAEFMPEVWRREELQRLQLAEAKPGATAHFGDIVYRSPAMRRVVGIAERLAPTDVSVVIEGESGTGKELFARAIHQASGRAKEPFIAVNCGAIPDTLVESEFFGHVRGAFTGAVTDRAGYFEAADGGTLFLDEIGELPLLAQAKLLRVLQEKEVRRIGAVSSMTRVDVRVIAATNRNLVDEVAAGRFRGDLYYRLARAGFRLPSLRERRDEIDLLLDVLMKRAEGQGLPEKKLSASARELLRKHSWPGNVRELENTLYRLRLWSDRKEISADDVRDVLHSGQELPPDRILDLPIGEGFSLQRILDRVREHYISRALAETGGTKSKAAKLLGFANAMTFANWQKKPARE